MYLKKVSSSSSSSDKSSSSSSSDKSKSTSASSGPTEGKKLVLKDTVNVRKKPNTESEIVGKLYRGSAAKIVKRKGDWVKIKSGKVTGYINKEYLAIGFSAEKLIDDFGNQREPHEVILDVVLKEQPIYFDE